MTVWSARRVDTVCPFYYIWMKWCEIELWILPYTSPHNAVLTRIHRSLVGVIDREIQNNALWDIPSHALLLYIAKQSFINCFTLVGLSQFYTHLRYLLTPYLILAPALVSSNPLLWAKLNLGKELKHDKVLRFSDAIAVRTNYYHHNPMRIESVL